MLFKIPLFPLFFLIFSHVQILYEGFLEKPENSRSRLKAALCKFCFCSTFSGKVPCELFEFFCSPLRVLEIIIDDETIDYFDEFRMMEIWSKSFILLAMLTLFSRSFLLVVAEK